MNFCLLDLDGVLVDFHRPVLALHRLPLDVNSLDWHFFQPHLSHEEFYAPLGFDFWAGLPWTPDGRSILDAAVRFFPAERIYLLTSPCETRGCAEGKIAWVERELPDYRRRLLLCNQKEVCAGADRVLVDDSDHQCEAFERHGGAAVKVPRSWNSDAVYKGAALMTVVRRLQMLANPTR